MQLWGYRFYELSGNRLYHRDNLWFSIIVAQHFGSGDEKKLRESVAISIYLSIAITVVITIVSLLGARPLLTFMNTPADIIDEAHRYISIIFAGLVVTVFYNLLASILRALGDSKTPLYFLIVSSIANIILDLVFILYFSLGAAGAALATVIAQALSCILCLVFIIKKYPILKLRKDDWIFRGSTAYNLLKLGIPTSFQFCIISIGGMILQTTINGFGSTTVAACTAASKVESLAVQPSVTFGLAMATYAAQNLGAKKLDRIRMGMRKWIGVSMAFCIISTIAIFIFGEILVTLFVSRDQHDVIVAARQYLRTTSIFYCILGLLFVYRNALQGMGNVVIPMISGFVELIMRVGVALNLSRALGFTAICFAGPVAWCGATVLLVVSYYVTMRKLRRKFEGEAIAADNRDVIGTEMS